MLPGLAVADEALLEKYAPLLEKCYFSAQETDAKRACIGQVSGPCMAGEDGGETTLGMSTCLHTESVTWDRLLNQEYARARQWAVQMDQDESEYFPEFSNRVNALRDAQRAWMAFRDAECGLAYAVWGAGSMRHIAGTQCILDETAERVIELWALGDVMR